MHVRTSIGWHNEFLSSSKSNALWKRRVAKKERKRGQMHMLGDGAVVSVGSVGMGKEWTKKGRQKWSKYTGELYKSSTNKKILWLLSLKMPKPLSIPLASKDGIYADVVFVPEWPSCHLHFKIITNPNGVNGDVFKRLALVPRLTLKQKWQFHW